VAAALRHVDCPKRREWKRWWNDSSGKLHLLFGCLFGLLKERKDKKERKDERHLVFLMPSRLTNKSHILLLKTTERQFCFAKDSVT
jgi:hypothetical protein